MNSTAAAAAVIPSAKNVSGVSLIREETSDVNVNASEETVKLNSNEMVVEESTSLGVAGAVPNENNFDQSRIVLPQPVPDDIEHNLEEEVDVGSGESHFVRGVGETSNRISTKLKHKFKDLIEQQTSAIQKVQMFYESEINKIEVERVKILADMQCDEEQKKLVNDFYDEQLQMLEERVEAKLKMLREKVKQKCLILSLFLLD